MKTLLTFVFFCTTGFLFAQTAEEHDQLSAIARGKNDLKTALKESDAAVKLKPDSPEYHVHRGEILFAMKRQKEAWEEINLALKLNPECAEAYSVRAYFHSDANETKEALEDFGKAIEYAETDSLKFTYLAYRGGYRTLYRDFEGAYADLTEAYTYDSTDFAVLNNLAMVCDELGDYERSLKYLFRIALLYPEQSIIYSNIGFVYQKMGNHKKAITYFNMNIDQSPSNPYGYSNRAYSKLQLNDLKGAMEDIERSIKLMPENSYAYRTRALIHIANGKTKKACEDLHIAREKGFAENYGTEVDDLLKQHCN
jgi:tetratricopeptide (TPR) repeat protein